MRNISFFRGVTVWAATAGLLFPPQFLMAAEAGHVATDRSSNTIAANVREAMQITDVELQPQGTFTGQVVNAQGKPLAGAAVTLLGRKQQIKTVTDAQGWFRFTDLSGGAYRLVTGCQQQICRLWADGTAPPQSNKQMLVVFQGDQTVLGQDCGSTVCGSPVGNSPVGGGPVSRVKHALANPLVIGGIIAAAIAIPVAINNSDDDPSSP